MEPVSPGEVARYVVFATLSNISTRDPRVTNLAHFRPSSSFGQLDFSKFTMVKKISNGLNGDIFKYQWRGNKEHKTVAVKQLRNARIEALKNTETNEWRIHCRDTCRIPNTEDALTEIGVLTYLSKQPD